MKVEVTVDGETRAVEVDLTKGVVRWNGHEHPAKVVQDSPLKVELEVAGEKLIIEGWVTGQPNPPGPIVVSGETYAVSVVRSGPPVRTATPRSSGATPLPEVPPSTGGGTTVVPPMPGKVVEVRVKDGDHVARGQVLLVLEAMKMRNEVQAPVAGTVTSVRVATGTNVRAREPLVLLRPDP
jgi:glutaconyl-CoA/methylmalonyl-CoA decarboxylase subunit gamma